MFPVLCLGLVGSIFAILVLLLEHGSWPLLALAALSALVCAAGVLEVLRQVSRHRMGLIDWLGGGVVDFDRHGDRLVWCDWGVGISRRGAIDQRTGRVTLERRLACGLIPLAVVDRPLADFYRVTVETTMISEQWTGNRVGNGRLIDHSLSYLYSVSLVDRRADRLCVLDVAASRQIGDEFVGRLRIALEALIGAPGVAPSPPRPDADDRERQRQRPEGDGGPRSP